VRVLHVEPQAEPIDTQIANTPQAMQAAVGGKLEQFHLLAGKRGRRIAFYCNEDGRSLGLAPNRTVAGMSIVGPVLVAAVDGSTEVDLTDQEVRDLTRAFKRWPRLLVN
jgi:uncharacterized protein DUF3846